MKEKLVRLIGGNALAQSFNYASLAVCLALYSPEGFGEYSVMQLVATLLATALLLRQDRVVLSLGKRTSKIFIQDFSVLQCAVAIGVGCISSYFLGWTGVWVCLISTLVNLNLLYQCYLIRVNSLVSVNLSKFIQSVVLVALQGLLFFALDNELHALFFSLLISYVASTLYLVWRIGFKLRKINIKLLSKIIIYYRGVVVYSYPSVFLNSISNALPTFLIASIFGDKFAGIYNMAHRLTATPLGLVSQAMMQLFTKHSSEKGLGEVGAKYHYFRSMLNNAAIMLTGILFLVFYIALVFSDELLEWSMVPVAALLLLPWVSEAFRVAPLQAILIRSNLNSMELYFNAISTLLRVGYFSFLYFSLIEMSFLAALYIFSALSAMCWYLYSCCLSNQLADISLKESLLGRETVLFVAAMQVGWFVL